MKFYKNIILSTPMLILPFAMMSASCNSANNTNINSETLNKYKKQKQKLLDLLNQNADYSFCKLYKNIYSAMNEQIDKSNKEAVQKWINDTDSLIEQYKDFKSNIKPAENLKVENQPPCVFLTSSHLHQLHLMKGWVFIHLQ